MNLNKQLATIQHPLRNVKQSINFLPDQTSGQEYLSVQTSGQNVILRRLNVIYLWGRFITAPGEQ